MSKISIAQFEEKHVDQGARVLARSFIHLNTTWKHFNLPYEQVFRFMRGKILPALKSRWSFVLLEDDVVIGISVQYNLFESLKMPSMPNDLEFFKKLGKIGAQLQSSINLESLNPTQAIYGFYGVIDPDYANKGYSLQFWWELFSLAKISGWRYYYSRISSPVSLKMLQKLGAQILGEAQLKDDGLCQKFWMIRIDLQKPFPSYSMLKSMTKKKSKQPNAKL